MKGVLIVGAGFSGSVLARELAEAGVRCLVIDNRDHVGGNCYTRRNEFGIQEHIYGPHILNTNHLDVFNYVQKWGRWLPFTNKVKAVNRRGVFSFPINLHTINQFFQKTFNPHEAKAFIRSLCVDYGRDVLSFEEMALSRVGPDIYEAFFLGYTQKQWGVHPKYLPPSVFSRIPIRFNYDDNYYSTKYQMVPVEGYTSVIEQILDHPGIEVSLGVKFDPQMAEEFLHVFYSGSIDEYFSYKCGRLSYRTLVFERQTGKGDLLGNGVINHTDERFSFTREYEHKYFSPHESFEDSVVFREFSKEASNGDIPFYPVRLAEDIRKLEEYKLLAEDLKVTFMGRLGSYRYLDMDQVIGGAIDTAREWISERSQKHERFRRFGVERAK